MDEIIMIPNKLLKAFPLLVGLLCFSQMSLSGFVSFTDRNEWEIAAFAAGLDVFTEDFSSAPTQYSTIPTNYYDRTGEFSVSGTTWGIGGGVYDAASGILSRAYFDVTLYLDGISDGTELYGFGYDTLVPGARITAIDINGNLFNQRFAGGVYGPYVGFVGFIGTDMLIPYPDFRQPAAFVDGVDSALDNFSIATRAVPLPATFWLFASGLGVIGYSSLRQKKA